MTAALSSIKKECKECHADILRAGSLDLSILTEPFSVVMLAKSGKRK